MRGFLYTLGLLVACASCGKTEECKKLETLKTRYETAVARAKARSGLVEQTRKRLERNEKRAKTTMKELGLDLPETQLKKILDERLAKIPGATIQRTTRKVADGLKDGGGTNETLWQISFSTKSEAKGFGYLETLSARPPTFKLISVIRDAKSDKWLVELMRASVVEVPLNLPPTKEETPPDPGAIASEFGFCGASELRADIAKLRTEFDAAAVKAEEMSTLLPKAATMEGLNGRASLLGQVETENRRLIKMFIDAALKAKTRFKAIGVEKAVVLFEFYGGKKDRTRLDSHLPKELLQSIKELDSAKKDVIRLSVVNRVADNAVRRAGGSFKPGVGHAPHKPNKPHKPH